MCGIAAGNSARIPVHRYRLHRTIEVEGRQRNRWFGSIGLCRACVLDAARLPLEPEP